jgi:shikimate kinase
VARHLVVVGLMGTGKTVVASLLAEALGRPLDDNDRRLEAGEGEPASTRAQAGGLRDLHDLEYALLVDAVGADRPAVVAAAASVLDRPETETLLAGHEVVGLIASEDTMRARFAQSPHRPALGEDPIGTGELRRRRLARLRRVADLVVSTDETLPSEVVADILTRRRRR